MRQLFSLIVHSSPRGRFARTEGTGDPWRQRFRQTCSIQQNNNLNCTIKFYSRRTQSIRYVLSLHSHELNKIKLKFQFLSISGANWGGGGAGGQSPPGSPNFVHWFHWFNVQYMYMHIKLQYILVHELNSIGGADNGAFGMIAQKKFPLPKKKFCPQEICELASLPPIRIITYQLYQVEAPPYKAPKFI